MVRCRVGSICYERMGTRKVITQNFCCGYGAARHPKLQWKFAFSENFQRMRCHAGVLPNLCLGSALRRLKILADLTNP